SVVSGPATITGTTLLLSGATGTVTVRASQPGDRNHLPAATADRSFDVTAPPVVITTQPAAQTANAGQSVAFNVAIAPGSGPVTYQWRKDSVALAGATTAVLALAGVGASDTASYDVVIQSPGGSVVSFPAALSVKFPQTIAFA